MKKSSKIILALIFLLPVIQNLWALDFGVFLKNDTKISTQQFTSAGLNQQDSLIGWLRAPISSDGKIYFALEADVTLIYSISDFANADTGKFAFLTNLSLAKLTMYKNIWNGILQFNVGRFLNADATGKILSQEIDGAQLAFNSNIVRAIIYAGYTGFTNSRYDTIIETGDTTFSQDTNAAYQFNSPYVLTGVSVSLPYLFANQTVGLEGFASFGVGGFSGTNFDNNKIYITALMNGPIVKNLYYSASTTFGINNGASNLSKVSLTYYPQFLNSSVSFEALYASGNNGFLTPFYGITSQTGYYAYGRTTEYTGLIKAGLSGTIRPIDSFFVNLGTDLIFSCLDNFSYTGFQWFTQLQFQVYTDLKVGFSAYQFFGLDSNANNTAFSLNLAFAF